jgi:hypothetical protein
MPKRPHRRRKMRTSEIREDKAARRTESEERAVAVGVKRRSGIGVGSFIERR